MDMAQLERLAALMARVIANMPCACVFEWRREIQVRVKACPRCRALAEYERQRKAA